MSRQPLPAPLPTPLPAPRTVLVYSGLELLGDGVMKLPMLRALRHAFPQAHITWLAGKGATIYAGGFADLVAPYLDEVIQRGGVGTSWGELTGQRPLGGRAFDLVIDTQTRVKTTLILRRIPHKRFISGALGFAFSSARPKHSAARKPPRLVDRLLTLVALASGRPADPAGRLDIPPAARAEAALLLPPGPIYVGLAPGAGGVVKRWPLGRFVALAGHIEARGAVPVILLGPAEAEWVDELHALLPAARFPLQAAPDPNPLLTMALAEQLAAAVANDSGTGHLLAAVDTPLVSLFGPTPPAKFAPATSDLTIIRAQAFPGIEGQPSDGQMEAIPLEAVASALDLVLDRVATARPPPSPDRANEP